MQSKLSSKSFNATFVSAHKNSRFLHSFYFLFLGGEGGDGGRGKKRVGG